MMMMMVWRVLFQLEILHWNHSVKPPMNMISFSFINYHRRYQTFQFQKKFNNIFITYFLQMFIFYTKTNLKWTYLLQCFFISAKHHKSKLKWDFSLKCNYVSWAEICEWEKEEADPWNKQIFWLFFFLSFKS